MSNSYKAEMSVGLFIILTVAALFFLAFKVSGVGGLGGEKYYTVTCNFDNVGDLKKSSAVTMSGVKIGQVEDIKLDPDSLQAKATLRIYDKFNNIPADSSASILTQGLLGSNYIGLTPGFDTETLKNKSTINTTHSALILENIIGQLVYSLKNNDKKSSKD